MTTPAEYFAGKPASLAIFEVLRERIDALGPSTMRIASQITFGSRRKFAWIWLYNVTGAHPEGTVQIMLALDHRLPGTPVYRVTQVGAHRWNHLVVVHDLTEATTDRLTPLLTAAYRYGSH